MSSARLAGQEAHEWRRMRAWELHGEGWSGKDIAAALKVSAGAVTGWLKRARAGGVEALRRHPAPGPVPMLTPAQRAQLPAVLARGAGAYGFCGVVWSTKRIAVVIERTFGVRYHPAHLSRLLREEGLSVQKPIHRAQERDEAQVQAWREQTWPALLAKPSRRRAPSSS